MIHSSADANLAGSAVADPDNTGRRFSLFGILWKNILALTVGVGIWLALDTGYFSPDRPTRDQWDRIEKAKGKPGLKVAYEANFAQNRIDREAKRATAWGPYNGATDRTVQFQVDGVTINYEDAAWLGAVFRFDGFQAGGVYRVTFDAKIEGEPGAILVRNKQLDLTREQIPTGRGMHSVYFAAPPGSRDRVFVIFMPDGRKEPKGSMTITSFKIELVGS
jgi:hypothetical protein